MKPHTKRTGEQCPPYPGRAWSWTVAGRQLAQPLSVTLKEGVGAGEAAVSPQARGFQARELEVAFIYNALNDESIKCFNV